MLKRLLRKIRLVTVPKMAYQLYNKIARAANGEFYSAVAIEVAKQIKGKKGKREGKSVKFIKILDVGTGPGYLPIAIARRIPRIPSGKTEIVGVDINKKVIEVAKKNAAEAGISVGQVWFEVADAQKLPFKDEEFDFVISTGVLRKVKNPQKMLNEIYRVLKKEKEAEAWVYDFYSDAPEEAIKNDLSNFERKLQENKFGRLERAWLKLIRKREITIEAYPFSDISQLISSSEFKKYKIEKRGVWVKIILKK